MPTLFQISLSVTNRSVGGIAKHIGEKAIQKGWESFITYTHQTELAESNSKLIKISSKADFYLHALITRCFDSHGLGSYFSTLKLIREIEEIKPDIIHLHNIHGYYLNYDVLFNYLNSKPVPVVWTLHDCWAFTGHCTHFISANCFKWKTECNHCPLTREYPKSFIDNSRFNFQLKKKLFGANKNLHIVTVSNWLANFVNQSFLKNTLIDVIHNGIDLNVFHPQVKDIDDSKFTILGVSSVWNKSKGLYDFYKLRRKLDIEYRIVLVGLTDKQIKELPDGIEGFTKTENVSELVEMYASADVFVNTTYADTFPTVNIEALACGKPVITYRTGGSPEAIDDSTGVVVEQGDVDSIIIAIEKIKSKGSVFYTKNCRRRAELYFDKDKCFDSYISLYDKILKNQ